MVGASERHHADDVGKFPSVVLIRLPLSLWVWLWACPALDPSPLRLKSVPRDGTARTWASRIDTPRDHAFMPSDLNVPGGPGAYLISPFSNAKRTASVRL